MSDAAAPHVDASEAGAATSTAGSCGYVGTPAFATAAPTDTTIFSGSILTVGNAEPASYSVSTYPYNDVVLLESKNGNDPDFAQATGLIIGPHTILTASHVLWDSPYNAEATNVYVYPAYSANGIPNPPGSDDPLNTAEDWHNFEVNYTESDIAPNQSATDYAIIDVAATFTSWFGIETNFSGGTVNITGYPDTVDGLQQNETASVTKDATYPLLDYPSGTTTHGNSGGPLWIDINNSAYVVGVVSSSAAAVQITSSDLSQIQAWEAEDSALWGGSTPTPTPTPSPTPTPAPTTAELMMRASSGSLELYDIGGNTILSAHSAGSIGLAYQIVGFGDFSSTPNEADMLMRDVNNGALEVYNIQNSQIAGAASMGGVGVEFQVLGVGDFSGNANETDLLMRDVNNDALEYYDIQHDQIVGAGPMGAVGSEWQVLGIGDFSGNPNESDMLMRDSYNDALEYYDIQHNQIVGAGPMGAIGSEWQALGVGDFSSNANETDLLMRDTNTGALEYYDIQHNALVGAGPMGAIGSEWQPLGVGDFSGNANETDLLMRDTLTGALEYYDIQHNQIVGAGSMGSIGTSFQSLGVGSSLTLGHQLV